MKAKQQRKMLRTIAASKSQQRKEVTRISQAQQDVTDKYDWVKQYHCKVTKMGSIWGR